MQMDGEFWGGMTQTSICPLAVAPWWTRRVEMLIMCACGREPRQWRPSAGPFGAYFALFTPEAKQQVPAFSHHRGDLHTGLWAMDSPEKLDLFWIDIGATMTISHAEFLKRYRQLVAGRTFVENERYYEQSSERFWKSFDAIQRLDLPVKSNIIDIGGGIMAVLLSKDTLRWALA